MPELNLAKMLRCLVRYFTDGAVIGSKEFVNEAFAGAVFGKEKGWGAAAKGLLWSMRDLRVRV